MSREIKIEIEIDPICLSLDTDTKSNSNGRNNLKQVASLMFAANSIGVELCQNEYCASQVSFSRRLYRY